jgi:hypothetical protein
MMVSSTTRWFLPSDDDNSNVPTMRRHRHRPQQLQRFAWFVGSLAMAMLWSGTTTMPLLLCESFAPLSTPHMPQKQRVVAKTTTTVASTTTPSYPLWGLSIPSPRMTALTTTTTLFGTKNGGRSGKDGNNNNNNNNDDYDNFGASLSAVNAARTDISNFLTQRALQSFLFLLTQCRDEATVHWFEVSTKTTTTNKTKQHCI